jgi:hypothetical protein
MDKKLIILVIIFLIVGAVLGAAYKGVLDAPKMKKIAVMEPTIKGLSSKVVPSIVAYGQVTNISGRNITLTYSQETLTIKVSNTANIYSFSAPKAGSTTPTQQKASFSDIKKGDNLNINLKVSANGALEGQSVIILPSATKK